MAAIIDKAFQIRKTLGIRRAAGYLRNKGISLPMALCILCYRNHFLPL